MTAAEATGARSARIGPEAQFAADERTDAVVRLVVAKLRQRLEGSTTEADVLRAAREAVARFGDPPVRAFIPLLAEREAMRRLRTLEPAGHESTMPSPPAASGTVTDRAR